MNFQGNLTSLDSEISGMGSLTLRFPMELKRRLEILADAAKYDASCASNGSVPRDSRNSKGIGSATGVGICHSFTPDGRSVSLLKILLTNYCIYDCLYCVNRVSSSVERARFTLEEVVQLTVDFYRRLSRFATDVGFTESSFLRTA